MSRDESVGAAPSWPRRTTRPPTSRYTIDLEPRHRDVLRNRARELDTTASAIVRALIRRLDQDPTLAGAVVEDIEADERG